MKDYARPTFEKRSLLVWYNCQICLCVIKYAQGIWILCTFYVVILDLLVRKSPFLLGDQMHLLLRIPVVKERESERESLCVCMCASVREKEKETVLFSYILLFVNTIQQPLVEVPGKTSGVIPDRNLMHISKTTPKSHRGWWLLAPCTFSFLVSVLELPL